MNSYPYASGAIKSLSNKILDKNKIYRFSSLKKEELLKALNDAGYGTDYSSLEKLIDSEFIKLKETMKINTPNPKFTSLFFLAGDIQNITALYKSKIFQVDCPQLNETGVYDTNLLVDAIIKGKTTKDESLNRLVNSLNKATSGIVSAKLISRLIDNTIYSECLKVVRFNKCLKTYYKVKIDTTNILTFMRMKRLRWNVDQFKSLTLSGGTIDINELSKYYNKPGEELVKFLAPYYNEALSKIVSKYNSTNDISLLEINLNQLVLTIMEQFKNDIADIGPTVYYLFCKEAESKNIRMIYSNQNVDMNLLLEY